MILKAHFVSPALNTELKFTVNKQPPEVFFKKAVLIISQYLQQNTCVGVSF